MSGHFDPDGPAHSDGLFGLPPREDALVVVLPVPFEATTSYRRGTKGGPEAMLEASHQVDLCDLETGEPWRMGIRMEPVNREIVALNATATAAAVQAREALGADGIAYSDAVATVDDAGARLNEVVRAWTKSELDAGRIPAILGGDHACPLGAIQAAAERHPGIGILHVDAHADLRKAYEGFEWSHASILYNVLATCDVAAVVQVGVRDLGHAERDLARSDARIHQWSDPALADALASGQTWAQLVERMLAPLPETVWVTFDIDGLDPTLCPNTGTPVPGGLSWREATALLAALARSGRTIVGFDLCEVAGDDWDALVGARMLYKLFGWAVWRPPMP